MNATETPNHSNRYNAAVIIIAFALGTILPTWIQSTNWYATTTAGWLYEVRALIKPLSRIAILILTACVFLGINPQQLPKALGLRVPLREFWIAIGVGVLFSLPLLIVGFLGSLQDELALRSLPHNTLSPGFFEELFFRAFGFGLLVKLAHWRIWPTAILIGLCFGLAHIHLSFVQNMNIPSQAGWLALLASAGAFYAWLYAQWNFNLYLPITMHTLLDLCFELFNMNQSPLGSLGPIIAITLVFAIPTYITIKRQRSPKPDPVLERPD